MRTSTPTSLGDIGVLTQSFLRACRAENLSPSTVEVLIAAAENTTQAAVVRAGVAEFTMANGNEHRDDR